MLDASNSASRPRKQAERKPPPWSRLRVRGMLRERIGSLKKLAASRVYRNKPLGKPKTWAFFVAEIAWLRYRRGGDLANFRRAVPHLPPYFVISDVVARKALKQVDRLRKWREQCGESYRPTSPAKLGESLGVTAMECEELDLKTIRPAGWTPALAAAERKARKLERDRKRRANASAKDRQREAKRKRAWRARRGRGLARAAEAQRKREEIAASGRSRATYYRWRETERVRETKGVRAPILGVRERGRFLSHRTTNGAAAAGCHRAIGTCSAPRLRSGGQTEGGRANDEGAGRYCHEQQAPEQAEAKAGQATEARSLERPAVLAPEIMEMPAPPLGITAVIRLSGRAVVVDMRKG